MNKKLLLFDVDGTLVRLDGAGLRALDKTFFDVFGIKDIVYKVNFYGKTDPVIYENMMNIAGLPIDLLQKNKEKIRTAYLKHLQYEIDNFTDYPVIDGIIEFLNAKKNNDNYVIGLLTGNIEQGAYIKIGRWGLTEYFKFGAFGSDSKIRAELVDIAVNRAKKMFNISEFKKNNIFVIGDTPLDIKCAQDNNVVSIAVATGKYTEKELQEYNPDLCFANLLNAINII